MSRDDKVIHMATPERIIKYQNTIIKKNCIECGIEIYQKRRLKGICEECKKTRRSRFRPQTYKICMFCGKEFGPVDRLKKKFCSIKCKVNYLQGENHPRWQGGKSLETRRARAKSKYRVWREAVFARDNWTCQICGRRSKKNKRIEINAHHKESFAKNKSKRYDVSNGRTLCTDCHKIETHGKTLQDQRLKNYETKTYKRDNR